MSEKLLLVEDDVSLGETLKERLEKEGYKIFWERTVREARLRVSQTRVDLILFDVRLPDGTGFDLARELVLKGNHPPFLFLTAHAEAEDRLKGFEIGAEEFIPKPFHLKELLIRIKHVLNSHSHVKAVRTRVEFGEYEIDFEKFTIRSGKDEVRLAARDCYLLQLLIAERDRVVSRDEILDRLWGEDSFPTNRTIDNAVVRLRQALGGEKSSAIQSVRGVGYRWTGEIQDGK